MTRAALGAVLLVAISACMPRWSATPAPLRIVFVGNSLTYVNALPAVVASLAAVNGHAVSTEMLVQAGGTLSDRAADGSLTRLLAQQRFTLVILQERGGDLLCYDPTVPVDPGCTTVAAHASLVAEARRAGATPVMLGTYQEPPPVSRALQAREGALAKRLDIRHLPVSDRLRQLRELKPELPWLAVDRVHPGRGTTLVEAIWLYRMLFGEWPRAAALYVPVPVFATGQGFDGSQPASSQTTELTASALRFRADEVEAMITLAKALEQQP